MMNSFLKVFQNVGSVVGIIITLITFFGIISKKPIAALRKVIKEEAESANAPVKEKLEEIENSLESAKSNDLAIIRNTITHIYFKYKDEKKIPHYEKENVLYLYERYKELHGNSYVKNIIQQIESWEEII